MRCIVSFAPLISYGIMGILHRTFLALMPLADSQSPLYNTKLVIFLRNCNALVVNRIYNLRIPSYKDLPISSPMDTA